MKVFSMEETNGRWTKATYLNEKPLTPTVKGFRIV